MNKSADIRAALGPGALALALGDAQDPANPFGWAAACAADEAGDARDGAAETLFALGLRHALVPASWETGGTLTGMGPLLAMARLLTARDAVLMPRVMYPIGPVCVMEMAGTPDQKARISQIALRGGDIAFALSEPQSRSDVMSGTLTARKAGEGWSLDGEKWMIGRASAADAFVTLAKTGAGGPVGWSLMISAREAGIVAGPALRFSGMQGTEVGNLSYAAAGGELIGPEGAGVELTYRAQAPMKALSVAAALGPMETALRLAGRRAAHSYSRMTLAMAFADYMLVDAQAVGAMRILSAAPRQFSVWASVTKHLAIACQSRVFDACATVLGAASVQPNDPDGGIFLKMRRDAEIVRVIDINAVVNLRAIAMQLDALAARQATSDPLERFARLTEALALASDALPMKLGAAQVTNMGGSWATEALPALPAALATNKRLEGGPRQHALRALHAIGSEIAGYGDALAHLRGAHAKDYADRPELIALAQRFADLHAAGAATLMALSNPAGDIGWLPLALHRLAFGTHLPPPDGLWEPAWASLDRALKGENLLTLQYHDDGVDS